MSETKTLAKTPAKSPSQALPVKVAAVAEAKAPTKILPSRPMSTTPERSDQRPARQARMSGTASLIPEAKTTMKASNSSMAASLLDRRLGDAPREQGRDRAAEHVLERAGEQHHEPLDDDDHVAADLGLVEGELGAALIKDAEQDRGQDDADRVNASHERDRDSNEAEAGGEFEDEAVLLAEDHVDRKPPGERAGNQRRYDRDARGRDAAIDRRDRIGADDADLVAEPRAPDEEPDAEGG